jgi:hypothetical protein
MATTEELFISVSPQEYRKNKSSILLSQTDILLTLKHLQNIKVLTSQKNDLKKKLHKLLSSTLTQIDYLQEKMPTPQVPKTIQKHTNSKSTIKEKTTFSKRDEIEEELRSIQAKLQKLNS